MFKLDNGTYIVLAHVVAFGPNVLAAPESDKRYEILMTNNRTARITAGEFKLLVEEMADYIGRMAPKSSVI